MDRQTGNQGVLRVWRGIGLRVWLGIGLRVWLGIGLVVSILLLVILEPLHGPWWLNLLIKLVEAVAVATIIGLLVDGAMKQELSREVFFASVGYVLPPELRPEMRWLCQLNELCTQDTLICTLVPFELDSMKVQVQRTQVIKNRGFGLSCG